MSNQCTVLVKDKYGVDSHMVRIPCFLLSEVIPGAPSSVHPAFIVDGKIVPEIYISKYQNVVIDGKAYSLPEKEPQTQINHEQAVCACESKGNGWHLMTNAEWGALALWCRANGTQPHGNTDHGVCYMDKNEKGIPAEGGRVLSGTGPASWSHDGTEDGVYDLCGNVWEWVSGLKLVNGQIQMTKDNDAALGKFDWKAVGTDGSWKEPGEPQTICIDADGEKPIFSLERKKPLNANDDNSFGECVGCGFAEVGSSDGTVLPMQLIAGAVASGNTKNETGALWMRNYGTRMAARGGSFSSEDGGGIYSLSFLDPADCANGLIGFRAAYVPAE